MFKTATFVAVAAAVIFAVTSIASAQHYGHDHGNGHHPQPSFPGNYGSFNGNGIHPSWAQPKIQPMQQGFPSNLSFYQPQPQVQNWGSPYGQTTWHDTTHYDYHPGQFVPHNDHYHYQPGHYDLHEQGHCHN